MNVRITHNNNMNIKDNVRDRVAELPDAVHDCEACGAEASMQIRRSSLNEQFLADDVGLKCETCRFYRTHGIPFGDADEFNSEWEARSRRVVDFSRDEKGEPDEANLKALGYIAASEDKT